VSRDGTKRSLCYQGWGVAHAQGKAGLDIYIKSEKTVNTVA